MKRVIPLILIVFVFGFSAGLVNAQEKRPSNKHGIVFKVVEKTFPRSWKPRFNGFLMLLQESPAAIFISYPNDDESVEDLRKRILDESKSMFGVSVKGDDAKDQSPEWVVADAKKYKSDTSAKFYLTKSEDKWVQVFLFERKKEDTIVVYGYTSMRKPDGKAPKTWAKPDGTGVKLFKKFRKTITW